MRAVVSLTSCPVTFLKLLSASARTGLVAPHFRGFFERLRRAARLHHYGIFAEFLFEISFAPEHAFNLILVRDERVVTQAALELV